MVDDAFQPLTAAVRDLTPDLQTLIHCGDLDTPPDMLSWETLVAEADPIPDAQLVSGGTCNDANYLTAMSSGFCLKFVSFFTAPRLASDRVKDACGTAPLTATYGKHPATQPTLSLETT